MSAAGTIRSHDDIKSITVSTVAIRHLTSGNELQLTSPVAACWCESAPAKCEALLVVEDRTHCVRAVYPRWMQVRRKSLVELLSSLLVETDVLSIPPLIHLIVQFIPFDST